MGIKEFVDFFKYLAEHVGIAYAVALLVLFGGLYYIHREKERHLLSKDKEIERLTKEKDKLQDFLFAELTKLRKKKQ